MNKLISIALLLRFVMVLQVGSFGVTEDKTMSINEAHIHDPSIVRDFDGKYYVFGSHITTAQSDDMINWEHISNNYERIENTHFGNLSENLSGSFAWAGEDDGDCKGGFAVWAPDVYYNDKYEWEDGSKGAYMMYYSASSTYKRSCIGLAVSKDIKGIYSYVDTVIYSGFTKNTAFDENSTHDKKYVNTNIDELIKEGIISSYNDGWGIDDYNNIKYPNAIDPCVYNDKDGRLYLTYGSWSGGIFSLEINPADGSVIYPGEDGTTADGRMVDRYFGTHIAGGKGWSGEGPFIYYDEETEYFYLQTSYEWLGTDGGYHIRMFRSENPLGPFVDIKGNCAVYGERHAEHGVKMFGNYYFDSLKTPYTSGGHSSILMENGERYTFYHTRFKGTEHFQMRVHQMFMNEDNWPVIAPFRYLGDKLNENGYPEDEVLGFYEYIDHGNAIGEGNRVQTTLTMELLSDGTIKGIDNGKWEKNGKYVTINYNDEVLKGVFFKCSDENGDTVMTLSVVGGENRSIWGVKKPTENKTILPETRRISFDSDDEGVLRVEVTNKQNPAVCDKKLLYAKGIEKDALQLTGEYGIMLKDVVLKENTSIGFWVKCEEMKTYTPLIAVTKDFINSEQKWLSVTNKNDGNNALIWSRDAQKNWWLEGNSASGYGKDEWKYIMLVFDDKYFGEQHDMIHCSLYTDGYCIATGYAPKDALGETSAVYIGINPWDKPFKGCIDEISVFDRALDHSEVYSYFKNSKGEK